MNITDLSTAVRILHAGAGEISGPAGVATDRYMIDGRLTDGRVAVVEHFVAPGVLAAPVHRHTTEDEFSYVLEGKVAFLFGDEEIVAEAGDLVVKPRQEWHTFWNPGDGPTRILEIISPAGLEDLFRALGTDPDPERIAELAAQHGCDIDGDATSRLVERHGLSF